MEEVFNNIFYLIPIALVLAVRLINARNKKEAGNQQQKEGSGGGLGELLRKIQEAQDLPHYERTSTENREVYPQRYTPPGQKKAVKKTPAKAPPKKDGYHSVFPDAVSTAELSAKTATPQDKAPGSSILSDGIIKPGLTPLQQAIVWTEILGQPKGA